MDDWLNSLRKFQVETARIAPTKMTPPAGAALFTLGSGTTYFPDLRRGGEVIVDRAIDAIELENEGWSRGATSKKEMS